MVPKQTVPLAARDTAPPTSAADPKGLIKRPTVRQLTTLSDAALTAAVAAGTFPAPVKTGVRSVAWHRWKVEAWIANPTPIPSRKEREAKRDKTRAEAQFGVPA